MGAAKPPLDVRAPDWTGAACARYDPELWFASSTRDQCHEARRVCRTECPIAAACLEWALQTRPVGIWGATNEMQRTNLLRKRARRAAA
jgi:hypothetical protein